jgi:hypothetical protein
MPLLTAERVTASVYASVRGSTTCFYEWLEASDRPARQRLPRGHVAKRQILVRTRRKGVKLVMRRSG